MAEQSDIFTGRTGLVFHRNFLASISDYGDQLSKAFREETGIPVKCEFVSRSMGAVKLRFTPKAGFKSSENFKGLMKKFVMSRMQDINTYLTKAIKNTLGNSVIVGIDSINKETGSKTQWMGDKVTGDHGDKGDVGNMQGLQGVR